MAIRSDAISQAAGRAATNSPSRRAKVAREFESVFSSMMFKAMRSSVMRSGFIPQSTGEQIYTEMLDKEYASLLAKNASLGISDLILRELNQNQSSQLPSLSPLESLSVQPWMANPHVMRNSPSVEVGGSIQQRVMQWKNIIDKAAAKYDLDSSLISAVIAQESAGNPNAVSSAGAKGLMQLIDSTAKDMGVNQVFNPYQNIYGGSRYLRMMLDRFDGNERLALAAYNAGPSAVERYNDIPPYKETQKYVPRVLNYREKFAHNATSVTGNR